MAVLMQVLVVLIECDAIFSLQTSVFHPIEANRARNLLEFQTNSNQNIWELSGQYQGDIVLPRVTKNHSIWNNAEIPLDFDKRYKKKQKDLIWNCLKIVSKKTCIRPRLKKKGDKDYVHILLSQDSCSSIVGRTGGVQYLNLVGHKLGTGCMTCGTILHEFLHVLGFQHEQESPKRNNNINILWNNIQPGKEYNFAMSNTANGNKFHEKYDYDSIMHFSAYAFTKNGRETISPRKQSVRIGRRSQLSKIDINKIKKLYCNRRKTNGKGSVNASAFKKIRSIS